ncbi:T9SS type B sorting domain-containing protein [Cognatitamlana onchidii]|uniref:T9SS type B sorting domain-containing protein n=1 Tax=Cognatitamlana onchidii TaxID=2562860 RepID=UPI0010A69B96|nr:T9SS type B sorting domain-containing protein [Algibacter onchidii]
MNKPTCLAVIFILFQKIYSVILKFLSPNQKVVTFLLLVSILLFSNQSFAQLAVPFSPRLPGGNIKVKGDIVLIGNTVITGQGLGLPFNGSGNNNSYDGEYINVASGGDPSIFSSSTADLNLNNPCKKIVFAGLYWASVYPNEVGTNGSQQFEGTPRLEDWNQVKFKLPTGGFIDLVADNNPDPVGEEDDIIFDGYDPVNINNSFKDSPIVCYKNVTNLLQGLTEADGTYTVANLRATRGDRRGGCAAGWTLVVIYESPQLPSKFISVFDGYAGVQGSTTLDIPVSGFQTLPAPLPVNAKIGVAALEGDLGIGGDTFRFKASTSGTYTNLSDALNSNSNFFNSKITNDGAYMTNRNPNSENVLGFDIANVRIPNPSNSVLPNDATAGDLRLTTSGDGYGAFVTSFAVDIIEPNIVLTKIVEDELGNNIGGEVVNLGQQLNYVIGFQNTGNDDATGYTIRDVLPTNVVFNYPSDIAPLPPGVTIDSYDAATREIIFRVDDSVVTEFGPLLEIRFSVRVVEFCNLLNDACSNSVNNQAYGTYRSKLNPSFIISDDPSYDINNGCLLAPQATNFLADIDSCTYTEEVILCGASVTLTAPGGYDSYEWSTSPTFSPIIGTNQSIDITSTGTYYVKNNALAPCQTTDKQFDVITFGANVVNPVFPYADQTVTCPNDGKQLPNIFLCGGIGGKLIQTNLSDTTSMIWEVLDESSCSTVFDDRCANESSSCVWNQVQTGPDFMADTAGQYRLTLNYPGGCFNRFYFNVYTNLLSPNVSSADIFCDSNGKIVIGGVPSGYEYSIDGTNYQTSNTFDISTPDLYTVYIKQIGVSPNPCIFTVPDVQIRDRNFSVSTIINQPFCNGNQGNVVIAVNDVRPQYYYAISQGTSLIQSIGPVTDGGHTFFNLSPGTYTIEVSTEDGCTFSEDIEIIDPPLLVATSALTTPLTCTDGEITVTPVGGTPPYYYFVNSSSTFETIPTIPVSSSGTFDIEVVDSNNCSATISITVNQVAEPEFNVSHSDILCYGDNAGQIQFNVTNANGYAIEFSIDNGLNYQTSSVFSNLTSGSYQAMIRYTLNTSQCLTTPQNIDILEPFSTVTASAGVSQLAGCGPSGEGALRITNPQGGVPPYEFSFDNQASWTTTNEAFLAPGTYTLYARDSNGCVYPMPDIIIDQEPLAPTISISDPDFNCDGSANTTVTITNPGTDAFTYTYLLDGVLNPNTADPEVFENVPDGPHTVSVTYQLETVPTYSNLLLEDFGSGPDVSSPGINPAFCFERQVAATSCNGDFRLGNGEYTITNRLKGSIYGGWHNPVDHTSGSANGRYMAVDAGSVIPNNAVLYRKRINDIIPNRPIQVRFYATNLLRMGNTQPDASLTVELQDINGVALSSESTGGIPKTNDWVEYNRTINPGNNTSLDFVLRLEVSQTNGIDFAVDDIQVFQLPTACITQRDFPIVIDSGNAFSARILRATNETCVGADDGTITISAQNFDSTNGFQYSLDGINWITEMSSPHTIQGLSDGSYNVQIRYDAVEVGCDFSFNQSIAAANPLGVTTSESPVTCNDGATVTAIGTGGVPPYSYDLLDDTTATVINSFPANGVLVNVPAGNYLVRVTDANGCLETTTLNLVDSELPSATIINADYCYDTSNQATLEVSASGGQSPYQYSINGGAFQSNPRFTGLTPGTYNITIRDAYGCEFTLPTETIEPSVTISSVLTKELDCTASPDGIISGTITNGYSDSSSNYQYAVSFNGGTFTSLGSVGTTFTYTASASGTYQFQVTDDNACQALSNIVTVAPIEFPTATLNTVNPSCNGDTNGSVQIIPANGVAPYEYSFNGSGFSSTSLYTGLSAGINYLYEVRDSKNCVFASSFALSEPTTLVATASATPFSCDAGNGKQAAIVTINVPTTGTAPYTYSFNGSGYSSNNTLTINDNGTDQIINYSVQDANGCSDGGSLTLTQLNPPTDLDFTATDITCINTTSTATLTATNGVGALEYETIAPSPIIFGKQSSNVFTGLTPGTYLFRITDANGCYYSESTIISPVSEIVASGQVVNNVSCHGGSDGAVGFRTDRFSTSYSYSFNSGATVSGQTNSRLFFSGLSAGVQTITVTDDVTGCTASTSVTITEPTNAITIDSAIATNVHCNAYNSQITVSASNGTPGYTYAAVVFGNPAPANGDYQNSNIINIDTSAGSNLIWDVYVKDSNNCIETTTVTVILDAVPTVTVPTLATNQCSVASGFTFTATGTGLAPLTYSINGRASYQASSTFTVNAPGSYTVTIKDGNGCLATSANTVDVYEPITASALLVKDLTCAPVPTDASIDITVSGGNAPYTYEVSDDGGSTYSSFTGLPFTTSVADNYQFRITDANGCEFITDVVAVTNPVNPNIISVTPTQSILCHGEETGVISIVIDNALGLAPYTINVFNNTESRDYGTQTSGLDAGDYTITVTDAKGCTDTESVTISEPVLLVLDFDIDPITCGAGGVSLGRIIINSVTGGTANYTYHVTGVNGYDREFFNQTGATQVFEVVDFGLYEIIISDANGCNVIEQDILVASPPDDLDIDIATTVDCSLGGEAEVSIGTATTITGTGPFYFAIYTGPGMVWDSIVGGSAIWQLGAGTPVSTTFTGLIPGAIYTFIVYDDDSKCYYFETATTPIQTNSTLSVSGLSSQNVTCRGNADGNVSFDINSFYALGVDVRYELLDAQSLVSTGFIGTGTVPASGGLSVSNLGTLDFGNYIVAIEELTGSNAGCGITTLPFNITESAIDLSLTASSPKNQNCNELGAISAIAQGGTAPYEYILLPDTDPMPTSTDPSWATPNTFTTNTGAYTVYVKDAYGCIREADVTIGLDPEPTIDPVAQQCFNGTPLTINLVEGTGTALPPLTYSIGTGGVPAAFQSNNIFTMSTAGTYDLFIKDGNGCIASRTYVVEPPLLLDANLTQDLLCGTDASITLTPSGGASGPYSFEVSINSGVYNAIPGSPYTTAIAGTYQFRVTDAQSCTAESAEIIVTPNTTPTFTETHADVSCNGSSDGSIVVTTTSGIAPYQYSIDGGTTYQSSNVFNGLSAAGSPYSIRVRDAKNCESLAMSVTIGQPNVVSGTPTVSPGLTCGTGNVTQPATITLVGSGGTPPYTYSFDGGVNYSTMNTFETYSAGTVFTFVKDSKGCISSQIDVPVFDLLPPSDLIFNATAITCAPSNLTSDVTLTVVDGVGTLTYDLIAPASAVSNSTGDSSGIYTGLVPDTYTFMVTDSNGCSYTESFTVSPVNNITVTGSVANDVSCTGQSDGALGFRIRNYASTYSYAINSGTLVTGQNSGFVLMSGLSAGSYSILVTDESTDCTATYSLTVDEPASALSIDSATGTHVHCNNDMALITVNASGGTPNYSYAAVISGSPSPAAGDFISNNVLSVDTNSGTNLVWDVYVMDANSCGVGTPTTVTLINDALPTVNIPALASNQCNLNGDPFTFTATGTGVAPLLYSIGNGFQSSPTYTVSLPGDYVVTVKDANGCEATSGVLTVYPVLDVSPSITAFPTCTDGDGIITLTGSGGSGNYVYAISAGGAIVSGNTISNIPAGTHTLTIEDTTTLCTRDKAITLEAATPVSFSTTATPVSCNGGNDGTITVSLPSSNNNPIYQYSLDAGATMQTSNIFTGLTAGNYNVMVFSGRNCTSVSAEAITAPNVINVPNPTVIDYACSVNTNTSNFATITVNGVTGGSSNYTVYEFIRGGTTVQSGSSNVYTETDLLGGNYTIHVYDDKGCTNFASATILPFVTMDGLSVNVDNAITCTNNEDISIAVASTGGTLSNMEYTVEDNNNGTTGGVYSQTNNSGVFTNLPIGDFVISVTNLDTGCALQTVHYVNEPNTFDLTIDKIVDVTCFNDTDGSIEVTFIDRVPTPLDEAGPFSYNVVDAIGNSITSGLVANAGPVTLSGFASGTYTITANLVNAPFCAVTKSFTINAPIEPLRISETHTEITCMAANNDGTISATALGGWFGDYEFQLESASQGVVSAYSAVSSFTSLVAGNYTIRVRDIKGCVVSTTVLLENPQPITANILAVPSTLLCFGNTDGVIEVNGVTGGQGSNYTYTLNMVAPVVTSSGPQNSARFEGLGAGTYNVLVQDGYGCEFITSNVVINQPTRINALLGQVSSDTCIEGSTLNLSATGGTGPYEYSNDPSFSTVIGSFTNDTNILAFKTTISTTYRYYVRDANGCVSNVSNDITIDPLPELKVNIDATNAFINCTGDNTGVIVAQATGGLGNYIYSLQDGTGVNIVPAPIQSSPGVFTDLAAGTYQVRVTSGLDCDEVSKQVSITEPLLALETTFSTVNVSCAGGDNGRIEIIATGGTGVIKYAISPQLNQFFESPIFEDLTAGTYQVVVQDELGCFSVIDFEIEEPSPVMLSIVPNSIVPEICSGDLDGSFSVNIEGGMLPYSYSLDDVTATYTSGSLTQTQFDFNNLGGGDHVVYVRDAAGCESEWNVTLPESVLLEPQLSIDYGCTSNLSTNTVTVSLDAGAVNMSDVDFSLNGGPFQASNVFTDVPAGISHTITARHTNGCEKLSPDFDIDQIDPLNLSIGEGQMNQIVSTVSGGVGPYTYTLNGEDYGDEEKYFIYSSGDYTVSVTDANGCVSAVKGYFEYIDVCISNYFTPNGDGTIDEWGPGCTTQYEDLIVRVFDRYGRQIKLLHVNEKWDGTYNGKALPSGDYWYILKLNDPKDDREFIGHFTLYR